MEENSFLISWIRGQNWHTGGNNNRDWSMSSVPNKMANEWPSISNACINIHCKNTSHLTHHLNLHTSHFKSMSGLQLEHELHNPTILP